MTTTLICYISHPCCYNILNIFDEWIPILRDKGWSPLLPLSFLDQVSRLELESSALTSVILSHLARSEVLLLPPRWEKGELARVEKQFASMNDIPVFEIPKVRWLKEEFPTAEEFAEKYATVSIRRRVRHCV